MINKIKRMIPNKIKTKIKTLIYKGNTYTCPFCGFNSRTLAPVGHDIPVLIEKQVIGAGKRNTGCYKCGSRDRERLIYTYLKYKMKIFNNVNKQLKILHLAPEKNLSKSLLNFGFNDYICGDLFTEGYSYPEYVKNINILNIPYTANTFDLIICNHVLEHIPNDKDAMKELFRVLKDEGTAILQVPISKNTYKTFEDFLVTDPNQREIVFGQFDHVRIYGQDYSERLSSVGFQVERFNFDGDYHKYGFNKDEDIFIAKK